MQISPIWYKTLFNEGRPKRPGTGIYLCLYPQEGARAILSSKKAGCISTLKKWIEKKSQKMALRAYYRGHIFDFLVPPVNLSVLPVGLAHFSTVGALGAIGRAT